jgi:hypothetical protein
VSSHPAHIEQIERPLDLVGRFDQRADVRVKRRPQAVLGDQRFELGATQPERRHLGQDRLHRRHRAPAGDLAHTP